MKSTTFSKVGLENFSRKSLFLHIQRKKISEHVQKERNRFWQNHREPDLDRRQATQLFFLSLVRISCAPISSGQILKVVRVRACVRAHLQGPLARAIESARRFHALWCSKATEEMWEQQQAIEVALGKCIAALRFRAAISMN